MSRSEESIGKNVPLIFSDRSNTFWSIWDNNEESLSHTNGDNYLSDLNIHTCV